MIFSTSGNQDLVVREFNHHDLFIMKEHVTFAPFPIHSSCDASALAALGVLQYVGSQYLPAVSEASYFHVAVEQTPP